MAAPVIALRFRDTTPGIDTIEEHCSLIGSRGAVWWGWWRKETEDVTAADAPQGKCTLILLDRSTRRMFEAECERFSARGSEINPEEVPEYYRLLVGNIEGFFRITFIKEVEYDQALGQSLGERTMIWLGEPDPSDSQHLASATRVTKGSCILHLSDLHFGADYGFAAQGETLDIGDDRRTLTECIVADLERIGLQEEVAAIIVTGDFITEGDWRDRVRRAALSEFECLREKLGLTRQQIIAVPGNHDIIRYPGEEKVDIRELSVASQTNLRHEREFRTFADELIDRNWKESLNYVRQISLSAIDIQVCVLNSCTITATEWREYGYVGLGGLDAIRTLGGMAIQRPTIRFYRSPPSFITSRRGYGS